MPYENSTFFNGEIEWVQAKTFQAGNTNPLVVKNLFGRHQRLCCCSMNIKTLCLRCTKESKQLGA